MDNELYRTFNEEIHRYKNRLLYYARQCEWDTFKEIAGRLFDYVEAVEMSEIKRRFLKISRVLMIVLFCAVIFLFKTDPGLLPELARLKKLIALSVVGGCAFEFYFFLSFRMYMERKTAYYRKRRERFISSIEQDFREIILPALT